MLQTCKTFYADVVVCGGGPAGCAAGIAAAREGKRAIVLELRESLGGLCTNGYITGLAGVVNGIAKEWIERLDKEGHATVRPHLRDFSNFIQLLYAVFFCGFFRFRCYFVN